MLAMRIEQIEPGLGIEAMTLAAPRFENLSPTALSAMLAGDERTPDIAPLIDQLAGSVGENALFRMDAFESDVPERAVRRTDRTSAGSGKSVAVSVDLGGRGIIKKKNTTKRTQTKHRQP